VIREIADQGQWSADESAIGRKLRCIAARRGAMCKWRLRQLSKHLRGFCELLRRNKKALQLCDFFSLHALSGVDNTRSAMPPLLSNPGSSASCR
jgi:hypothetical protein